MKLSLFNIHDVVLFITATLCLVLALCQFLYPNKSRVEKTFLIAYLFDVALGICSVMLLWQPAIKIHPLLDNYLVPYLLFFSLLVKGPLLYGYVSAATTPDYRPTRADFIHLLPLAIYFLALTINHQLTNVTRTDFQGDKLAHILSTYEWHSVKTIPLLYAVMALHKLHGFRKQLPDQVCAPIFGDRWLVILVWGSLLNWGWSLGTHLLGFFMGAKSADIFGIFDNYITSGLISALLVYSLTHINSELTRRAPAGEFYVDTYPIEKIVQAMEVEKLYLNPRLNIERLAEHINLPYRDVSTLINKHFHVNFNEYINLYRINEAKRLLADEQSSNLTINEIYAQSGFNSKSAFHRFFSRLVGVSPTEFRKLASESTAGNYRTAI